MRNEREVAQWTLDVTVFHGPSFGHEIRARVLTTRGGWTDCGTWRWNGLGVDAAMLQDIESRIAPIVSEHLVTRYGIQGVLPNRWAGEPGSS